jgi:hypothetical protein
MDTNSILFLIWIVLSLVILGVSIVALLSFQTVVDHLQKVDPKNWNNASYKTIAQLLRENITWILLVLVCLAELVSIAFDPVRGWFVSRPILASGVYLAPILILTIVLVILRFQAATA